jgi:hypothetical protein
LLFRRAYYLGPGGEAFFYDEPIAEADPAFALYANVALLPTCPEDSDNCQGLGEQAQLSPEQQKRADALQVLVSLNPDLPWQDEGMMFISGTEDNPAQMLIPYNKLEVSVSHVLPFGMGPEARRIMLNSLLGGTGFMVCPSPHCGASYDRNKPQWDAAIVAIRALGVQVATPSVGDRDIRSIK